MHMYIVYVLCVLQCKLGLITLSVGVLYKVTNTNMKRVEIQMENLLRECD